MKFQIDHYYNYDNQCETIELTEKKFHNIQEGIQYLLKKLGNKYSEIYLYEPNKAIILIKTRYYNKNGNRVYGKSVSDNHNSETEIVEIERIEE